jgi:hypothetical protein
MGVSTISYNPCTLVCTTKAPWMLTITCFAIMDDSARRRVGHSSVQTEKKLQATVACLITRNIRDKSVFAVMLVTLPRYMTATVMGMYSDSRSFLCFSPVCLTQQVPPPPPILSFCCGGQNPKFSVSIDDTVLGDDENGNDLNFGDEISFQFGECGTGGGGGECSPVVLEVYADGWAQEISVEFAKSTGEVFTQGEGTFENFDVSFPIEDGCVDLSACSILTVFDSYGDGYVSEEQCSEIAI